MELCQDCGLHAVDLSNHECKTEPTNEQVAVALGWEIVGMPLWWSIKHGDPKNSGHWLLLYRKGNLPDFTHDNNASWKYVWPVLERLIESKYDSMFQAIPEIKDILWKASKSSNPAMYFAIKLIELKGK